MLAVGVASVGFALPAQCMCPPDLTGLTQIPAAQHGCCPGPGHAAAVAETHCEDSDAAPLQARLQACSCLPDAAPAVPPAPAPGFSNPLANVTTNQFIADCPRPARALRNSPPEHGAKHPAAPSFILNCAILG